MILAIFIAGTNDVLYAQLIRLDTNAMKLLVEEWNIIHNVRSVKGFENIYSDQILFYTRKISKDQAITLKQAMYKRNPEFRQRIASDVKFTAYSKGLVKGDFTKEVLQNGDWVKYPSYILLTYEEGRIRIVGESEYPTDKKLKFTPDLGPELNFEAIPPASGDVISNIGKTIKTPDAVSLKIRPLTENWLAIILGSGGLLILYLLVSGRRKMPQVAPVNSPVVDREEFKPEFIPKPVVRKTVNQPIKQKVKTVHQTAPQQVVQPVTKPAIRKGNPVKQSEFENYVLTLFDPMYFSYKKIKNTPVIAGSESAEEDFEPTFEFQFSNKDTDTNFAIQLLFREENGNEVRVFSYERLKLNQQFQDERGMQMYYILGLGGTPDHPAAVYLLPAKLVKHELVAREALKPFRKFGMFFYNQGAEKLQ